MGAVDYLPNSHTALKTLLENDTELGGYASTPYSITDELVRVQKHYPEISVELLSQDGGEFCTGNPEELLKFQIRTYTKYTNETNANTRNLQIAGRVVEILRNPTNWSFTSGSYRIDVTVNYNHETSIGNKGKISRASEILADVYLRE